MDGPAHRSVSSIRPSPTASQSPTKGAPTSPHTPIRAVSSSFASPSTLRAEEDYVIIEIGNRFLRAGFAGDALPKAVIGFNPEKHKRVGDYRQWQAGYAASWRKRGQGKEWGEKHELWNLDMRGLDLGLVGDKIERAMKEAFTNYLLIDSRPRRIALVLPSAMPLPLLSTVLYTLFNTFQPPTISLMSAPVLTTFAAGLRAALIVDIGWAETVATAVYEYREVHTRRTVRASKLLGQEMLKLLESAVVVICQQQQQEISPGKDETYYRKMISFQECEEVIARMAWCKPSKNDRKFFQESAGLQYVQEEIEIESGIHSLNISERDTGQVSLPLSSTNPPVTLQMPFSTLAEPCEIALLADGIEATDLDDEELPLHLLVYQTLLRLPVDVRSVCMSRVIFTGGASNIPGLKSRVIDEVQHIIYERGWNPVRGIVLERLRNNPRPSSNGSKQANHGSSRAPLNQAPPGSSAKAIFDAQEPDPIEDKIKREARKGTCPSVQGSLRVVDSLGSWSGASLASQLKISAVSVIEREQWLQTGAAGASRSNEIAIASQRQSMGPAGLRAGPGDRSSWTLGPWG